jgi:hypothetical protein
LVSPLLRKSVFPNSVKLLFHLLKNKDPGKHKTYGNADYGIEQAQQRLTPGVGRAQRRNKHYDGSGDFRL